MNLTIEKISSAISNACMAVSMSILDRETIMDVICTLAEIEIQLTDHLEKEGDK